MMYRVDLETSASQIECIKTRSKASFIPSLHIGGSVNPEAHPCSHSPVLTLHAVSLAQCPHDLLHWLPQCSESQPGIQYHHFI